MSTSYYSLRAPVMAVRFDRGLHVLIDGLGLWLGQLSVEALHIAADRDTRVALRSGARIVVSATGPDDEQAISEYGELVTLGQLRRGEAP